MNTLMKCLSGPRLLRRHKDGTRPAELYNANLVESTAERFMSVIRFCWSFSYWTSPFMLTLLYRRGYFSVDGVVGLGKFGFSVSLIYIAAWFVRGVGRLNNIDYVTFMGILTAAQQSLTANNRRQLAKYDFSFWAWPVDFKWSDVNKGEVKKSKVQASRSNRAKQSTITQLPCGILSYICANTFGRRMMFPGSTALINSLLESPLMQGRAKLIEEYFGTRAKVETEDKNEIDTMFVDRRGSFSTNGKTLVICCEGNSGFYEIGCTVTPLEAGYSVLGWNHPGFAGSSGKPTPGEEQCAIDAVMQYAIHKLDFTPDNIWLFAWSIGGYTATWAAMNYPDIKYLTLDATFDDVLPLAVARMPQFASDLVSRTIRTYLNLNNVDQLCRYPGPVLLIRRTQDEMITTTQVNVGENPILSLPSNRGNFLLLTLLQQRYPNIVTESTLEVLSDWLSRKVEGQMIVYTQNDVNDRECSLRIASYIQEHSSSFPMMIGEDYTLEEKKQLALYLANKYLDNFDTTHCTPLPSNSFRKPWIPGSQES